MEFNIMTSMVITSAAWKKQVTNFHKLHFQQWTCIYQWQWVFWQTSVGISISTTMGLPVFRGSNCPAHLWNIFL